MILLEKDGVRGTYTTISKAIAINGLGDNYNKVWRKTYDKDGSLPGYTADEVTKLPKNLPMSECKFLQFLDGKVAQSNDFDNTEGVQGVVVLFNFGEGFEYELIITVVVTAIDAGSGHKYNDVDIVEFAALTDSEGDEIPISKHTEKLIKQILEL